MLKSKTIVIKCGAHLVDAWVENIKSLIPDFNVKRWDDTYNNDDVEYVIGWCPDALWINDFTQLKAVVSIGSGVDHIMNLDQLRPEITVIRTVSEDLIQRMREFVTLCVLSWHRQFPEILENNNLKNWKRFPVATSDSIHVGIMGYGGMGKSVAESLSFLGYRVSVWAAKERSNLNYEYYHGDDALEGFVRDCDVLICMLPLTARTENILNKSLMSKIKVGGCLINVGRGGHLVDSDLQELIANGHLSAAYLDGFRQEPLPPESSFWGEEKIYITCHSAAYISPDSGPRIIAENIKKYDSGREVSHIYDRKLGY